MRERAREVAAADLLLQHLSAGTDLLLSLLLGSAVLGAARLELAG